MRDKHFYSLFYVFTKFYILVGSLTDILVKAKHVELAVEDYVPIGLHGIDLKPPIDSQIAWNDVGGLSYAKKIIVETLKWPTQVRKKKNFMPKGYYVHP